MRATILTIILFGLSVTSYSQDWQLKKDKEGIKCFTKPVQGSQMKAIKAETEFHCSLETCVSVLRDIPNLIELFPDCERVEKVMQTDKNQIHYLHLNAPWPVADRDATFQLDYDYISEKDRVVVTATTVVGKYPEQKGVVRLTDGGGTWEFTRIDDEHTKLLYHYHGNPGGSIPAWLANSVAEENPFRLIQNFHKLVKLERYKGKSHAFMQ